MDATDAGEGAAETPAVTNEETNALLSRLRVIEDQPLESRAEAFGQIHEQLRSTLEGGEHPA